VGIKENKLFSNSMLVIVEWFIHSDGGFGSLELDWYINAKAKNKLQEISGEFVI
jgi:hypothetical protein